MMKKSIEETYFTVTHFMDNNLTRKITKTLTPKTNIIVASHTSGIRYFFSKKILGNKIKIGDKIKQTVILENEK